MDPGLRLSGGASAWPSAEAAQGPRAPWGRALAMGHEDHTRERQSKEGLSFQGKPWERAERKSWQTRNAET